MPLLWSSGLVSIPDFSLESYSRGSGWRPAKELAQPPSNPKLPSRGPCLALRVHAVQCFEKGILSLASQEKAGAPSIRCGQLGWMLPCRTQTVCLEMAELHHISPFTSARNQC